VSRDNRNFNADYMLPVVATSYQSQHVEAVYFS